MFGHTWCLILKNNIVYGLWVGISTFWRYKAFYDISRLGQATWGLHHQYYRLHFIVRNTKYICIGWESELLPRYEAFYEVKVVGHASTQHWVLQN